MNDTLRGARWGMFGAIGGGMIGGFTWVVVAGILLRDPLIWGAAILAAAVVGWSAWRLSVRWPAQPLLVIGWVLLLVGLLDLAFLGWVLPRLPVERASIWFGTDRASFAAVRPWAAAASVIGVFVVLYVLWRARWGRRPQ